MDEAQWQQIDHLFHAALEHAPHERAQFLVTVCNGDASLQREIATLLAAHEQPGEVWEVSASGLAVEWLNDQAPTPALSGEHLGHYQIQSLLGKGGMGEVWYAHDTALNRDVACKILPAAFAQNADHLRRFKQEAQAISTLNHPNIITIHEIGQRDDLHFIITEFIDGQSLRQHTKGARLPLPEVIDIALQIASALAAAHLAGIVHRDIKPENIMVRRDGYVKVLDFGLAKLTVMRNVERGSAGTVNENAETSSLHPSSFRAHSSTLPGIVMGTSYYMSPEQARGITVDARSDIWSLGCVLYEMVTGRKAFDGATTSDVIAAILHHELPHVSESVAGCPAELNRILEKAVNKDRETRYQAVDDLATDLKKLSRQLDSAAITSGATAVPTADQAAARTTSSAAYVVNKFKQYRSLVFAALLVLLALAATAYFKFAPGKPPPLNSIAVLPFANTSGDPSMDYLSDGISESLINSLSQMPGLKVIARSSSFKYKGKEISPEEVAKALGVQTILSGRITQRGESLQVSTELMNVHDKTQMWGEQFNRQVKDVLYIQNEISQQIASRLRLRLTKSERQHFDDAAKANPQAYELLLRARFHRLKRTPQDLNKAAEYYQQALAIDPNYALAHVSLAGVYSYMASNGYADPKALTPKAEAALQRALELDETLPQIHATLAEINKNSFNWAGAERAFKRTIELDPNMASAHSGFAYYLSTQQRHEEALAEIKKARELDPLAISYRANMGHILYFAQQYDQAIEQLKQTIELDRNYEYSHVVLGYAYAASGRYAQALTEYQETRSLGGDTTSLQCYLGYALAKMGQREEAKAILSRVESGNDYVSPAELALLYGGLGEKEKALSALERAYAEHDLQLQFLTIDPHYNDLASEARFTALLQKVGLAK